MSGSGGDGAGVANVGASEVVGGDWRQNPTQLLVIEWTAAKNNCEEDGP